jgi:hypothetical protein
MCVIHGVKCECDVKQIDIIMMIKQVWWCELVGRDWIAPEGLSELQHSHLFYYPDSRIFQMPNCPKFLDQYNASIYSLNISKDIEICNHVSYVMCTRLLEPKYVTSFVAYSLI